MTLIGHFPSGQPILPVRQADCTPKAVFVLGVYASAVHSRWAHPDGRTRIAALVVASEPEIFWTGQGAEQIIAGIATPDGTGRLVPAGANLNGPSGRALDESILSPLGLSRADAWLCDLVPHSCMNPGQKPPFAAKACRDHPLRWFAAHFGANPRLSDYGETPATYGQLHPLTITGRDLLLLPLAHPRQIARLGAHSDKWAALHAAWQNRPPLRLPFYNKNGILCIHTAGLQ